MRATREQAPAIGAGQLLAIPSGRAAIGPVLDDNAWHFVTGEREGSTWKIFVDGELADANNVGTSGSINSLSDSLFIGRFSGAHYCTAVIDDLRIFNRALSESEVESLYIMN